MSDSDLVSRSAASGAPGGHGGRDGWEDMVRRNSLPCSISALGFSCILGLFGIVHRCSLSRGESADGTALAQDTSTYQALSHSFETLLASYRAQRATHDAHLLQCALEKKVLPLHPGGNPAANLKSISHRCHPILVAFAWELTKETIHLPLGCLQGGH